MSKRGPHPASWLIPDDELIQPLIEMITPIVGISEGNHIGYWRGWERLAHGRMEPSTLIYPVPKLAGKALGLASICWKVWPPQEADDEEREKLVGRAVAQQAPEPDRPESSFAAVPAPGESSNDGD